MRTAALVLGVAVIVGCGGPRARGPALLDLSSRPVDPLGMSGTKAAVLVFTRIDCPVSNRYAPELNRLHAVFRERGIAFFLVYVESTASPDAIRAHLTEYHHGLTPLRDPGHAFADVAGATVTPEAAVFVPGGSGPRMVYRGRIDDQYQDVGRSRPAATTHDLERVLEAVVAGGSIQPSTTPATGCVIADLR